MTEAKVRVSGEDNGVSSLFERLKVEATDFYKDIASEARQFTTNTKEANAYISDQIQLIEKRNRIESDQRTLLVRDRVSAELGSQKTDTGRDRVKDKYAPIITEDNRRKSEGALYLSILREIHATLVENSKKELLSEKKTAEDKAREDDIKLKEHHGNLKGESGGGGGGGGDIPPTDDEDRKKSRGGIINTAASVATASNSGYMLASMAALIAPALGGIGISMLASKALGEVSAWEKSRGRVAGMIGSETGVEDQGYLYGRNMSAVADVEFNIAKASGKSGKNFVGNAALEAIQLERVGIGMEDISSLHRLKRSDTNHEGVGGSINHFIKMLSGEGVMKGGNITLLSEYLQVSNRLGEEQVSTLGKIDSGVNDRMVAAIGGMSNTFRNPVVLGALVQNLQKGLTGASTPQLEALQYSVLGRLPGSGSLWEMEKMKEKGLSQKGYLSGMLGQLKSSSFGTEDFYRNIKTAFGTSATIAEEMGKSFEKNPRQFDEEYYKSKLGGGIDYKTRAEEVTGILEKSTAKWDNAFTKTGNALVSAMDDLGNTIGYWIDKLLSGGAGGKELVNAPVNQETIGSSNTVYGKKIDTQREMDTATGNTIDSSGTISNFPTTVPGYGKGSPAKFLTPHKALSKK